MSVRDAQAIRSVLNVIDAAWRLVETLRVTHPDAPYEDLERALHGLDAEAGVAQKPSTPPDDIKILKDGLVAGRTYVLHTADGEFRFKYLGPTNEDVVPGADPVSFWLEKEVDKVKKVEKWFYADAGLEQYNRHSANPTWHSTNWVSTEGAVVDAIMKAFEEVRREGARQVAEERMGETGLDEDIFG